MSYVTLEVERSTRVLTVRNAQILMYGDTAVPVKLYFSDDSERVRLDEGEPIVFEVKQRGEYTADAVASCAIWTRGETDDDPYEGTIDVDAATIGTLIGTDAQLLCMGGVQWEEGGAVRSSQTADFRIGNVVVAPTGAAPATFTYLRSDGASSIFRPDATSSYIRP